jgi:hypothetical protein
MSALLRITKRKRYIEIIGSVSRKFCRKLDDFVGAES